MPDSSLLQVNDSLLIVIDIQPGFVQKESENGSKALVQRMRWLIKIANWLKVPLVITAEDIPRTGSIPMTFGLAAQPDILEAVQ